MEKIKDFFYRLASKAVISTHRIQLGDFLYKETYGGDSSQWEKDVKKVGIVKQIRTNQDGKHEALIELI